MTTLTLRAATLDDADNLLRWRNDPVAVAVSQTQRAVTLDEHLAWLHDVLSYQIPVHLFVIEENGVGIGSCRLASELARLSTAWVSLVLTPELRGNRYGWQALDLLMGEAVRRQFAVLKATINRNNLPSRRLFSGRGFVIANSPTEEWLEYERTL